MKYPYFIKSTFLFILQVTTLIPVPCNISDSKGKLIVALLQTNKENSLL